MHDDGIFGVEGWRRIESCFKLDDWDNMALEERGQAQSCDPVPAGTSPNHISPPKNPKIGKKPFSSSSSLSLVFFHPPLPTSSEQSLVLGNSYFYRRGTWPSWFLARLASWLLVWRAKESTCHPLLISRLLDPTLLHITLPKNLSRNLSALRSYRPFGSSFYCGRYTVSETKCCSTGVHSAVGEVAGVGL